MTPMRRICLLVLAGLLPSTTLAGGEGPGAECGRGACDGVTIFEVGHAKAQAGTTVSVPVLVRDVIGTPLGSEKSSGARIDGFSFRVRFSPVDAVVEARVRRAGVTEHAVPRFEVAPRTEDGVSYLGVFDTQAAAVGLVPTEKGQTVAMLELTLSPRVARSTRVELRLDPAATVLSNAAGTVSESVANGQMRLSDGSILIY